MQLRQDLGHTVAILRVGTTDKGFRIRLQIRHGIAIAGNTGAYGGRRIGPAEKNQASAPVPNQMRADNVSGSPIVDAN